MLESSAPPPGNVRMAPRISTCSVRPLLVVAVPVADQPSLHPERLPGAGLYRDPSLTPSYSKMVSPSWRFQICSLVRPPHLALKRCSLALAASCTPVPHARPPRSMAALSLPCSVHLGCMQSRSAVRPCSWVSSLGVRWSALPNTRPGWSSGRSAASSRRFPPSPIFPAQLAPSCWQ